MLCEALVRLAVLEPLPHFRYVGLGGISFKDFALFHQRLGITDMVSIEGETQDIERIRFNKPYSCIRMRWGKSPDILPTLGWPKRAIVWLDYDEALDEEKLEDLELVVSSVKSGSVIVVTVDAEDRVERGPTMPAARMERVRELIGEERIPRETDGTQLAGWGLADLWRKVVDGQIRSSLGDRNRPEPENRRLAYRQLFNFHYADNARMLTVGGYIASPDDSRKLGASGFEDLDYVCGGEEACLIEVPVLTWREALHLDRSLPSSAPRVSAPVWLPQVERRRYGRVYRYFPTYLEAEI